MTDPHTHHVTVEMNYLDDSSWRELLAYRKLGSVRELRRLKDKEFQRLERRMHLTKVLDECLACATFVGALVSVLFMLAIFS